MDNDQPGGSSSRLNPVELIVPPSAGQSRPAPRIITMSSGTNIGSVSTNPIVTVEPAGIENPANVRNLRDILKFTTKMTADAATENNDVIDLTYADEVVEVRIIRRRRLNRYCPRPRVRQSVPFTKYFAYAKSLVVTIIDSVCAWVTIVIRSGVCF